MAHESMTQPQNFEAEGLGIPKETRIGEYQTARGIAATPWGLVRGS
jgi:hypothetical protein